MLGARGGAVMEVPLWLIAKEIPGLVLAVGVDIVGAA